MRTFTDRKSVGRRLAQPETVPHRPTVEKMTVLGIELLIGRYASATHLPRLPILFPIQRQHATAHQRLHRFRPYPTIGRGESYVTIVNGLAHGNLETDAQTTDEIVIHVTIEHKSMYHLDLFAPGIKIKAYGERKPFPPRDIVRIAAFRPHQCPDIPGTFHRDAFHLPPIAGEMQYRLSFCRRTVLRGAQQGGLSAYRLPSVAEAVKQATTQFGNISLNLSGGHPKERGCLVHPHLCPGTVLFYWFLRSGFKTDVFRFFRYHGGHSGPFDRTVRPVSQRPTVRRDVRPVPVFQHHTAIGLQFPLQERNAQTDRTVRRRPRTDPTQIARNLVFTIKSHGKHGQSHTQN